MNFYNGHSAIGFGWTNQTQHIGDGACIGIGTIISGDTLEGILIGVGGTGFGIDFYIESSRMTIMAASSYHAYAVGAIVF